MAQFPYTRHLVLFSLAAALVLNGCGNKNQAARAGGPLPVSVEVMRAEPVALMTQLSGRTTSVLVSEVRPQVGGIIKARLFTEGSLVTQGQPLYQIDPATYQAAYNSAQATLANANAALTTAKLKADRYKELVTINAISKQDNDDAQATLLQAQATVASAQASVETARINLGYTRVVAPISGRIGKSAYTPGALVTASQADALATIQKTDQIYVDINQSVSDLLAMKEAIKQGTQTEPTSAEVTLVLDNGKTYPLKGKLEFADVTVDEGTGTVTLRATFANPEGILMPGMYVQAQLSTGTATNGILVEQAAVQRDAKGTGSVFVVGADNKVASRTIQTGQSVGEKWLVTSGLVAGDQVIVNNLQKVAVGTAVKATPVTPAKAGE